MIAEEVGPFFRVGLVPLTGMPWLEVLRERHERACVKAARAELALQRMADEHERAASARRAAMRQAARDGSPPPTGNHEQVEQVLAEVLREDLAAAALELADVVESLFATLRSRRKELHEPALAAAAIRATGRIDEWRSATAAARPVEALGGLSRTRAHERPVGRLRARANALVGSSAGPPSPGAVVGLAV